MPYLSVHFREKLTVDGEQVHFAVSKDGFCWEKLNSGKPILFSEKGSGGVRDIEIVRRADGKFSIMATDLCVVKRMDKNHNIDWKDINHNGSKFLSYWESEDLVNFSEQKLLYFGRDDFGCLWAPEVTYDDENGEYIIHWGSTVKADEFSHMSIYCCKTRDFENFTYPELFFTKENEILDSHLVKHNGVWHFFYKNSDSPSGNMHETAKTPYGEFTHDDEFDSLVRYYTNPGSYEGATTYTLPDGRWCLMLDFFGCPKKQMGYVPFVSEKVGDTHFKRADSEFKFPYGFKHGRFIEITQEEYDRLKEHYPNG